MGRLILFGGVFLGSSAVEQSTVNRPVVGSNPTRGAIFFQTHEKLRQSTLALRAIRQRCYPTPESEAKSTNSYHSTKYHRPRLRRSEERRTGKECVRTWRTLWSSNPSKKNDRINTL